MKSDSDRVLQIKSASHFSRWCSSYILDRPWKKGRI